MIRNIWKHYNRYLNIANKESKLALTFGIVAAFFETLSIYLLANLITNLENEVYSINIKNIQLDSFSKEIHIIFFILSAALSAFLYYLSNKNIVKAKSKIERFIRKEITDLTINIKWEYYLRLSQGDISKSIISEGQNISEGFMYFLSAITYSIIAITYFIACLILVPDTFFVLIIYAIFAFRIYVYYSRKADYYGKDLSKITSSIGKWTASIFNNLKYLKAISKDNLARDESNLIFKRFALSYENAMIASYKSKLITEILTIIFISLAVIFIIVRGSNISNLILSLSLFVRMTPKVYNAQSRMLDSLAMVSWPKIHSEKIKWAKNYNDIICKNKKIFKFNGDIIFESVEFNYPGCESILKNINLKIKNNEILGIIGKSGSGKSTILDLITGIIKPSKGNIYLSGKNINNININSWRDKLGIVMQENFYKNDTVASNITLGKEIDFKKIKSALIKANAWDFVSKLPMGINELIFDRGVRFSGGERQKLALARALYFDPEVLLLDEPSTGLDKVSENQLISSIEQIKGKMTIIIISHKKEVVHICDRVLEIKDKELKEL